MKVEINNSEEFERLLEGLGRDVVDSAIHYRLHRDLRDSVKSFESELNHSPAFWSLTLGAHLDAARSRLLRAYDQHPRALSLRSLIETIRENLALFGAGSAPPEVIKRGASPPDPATLDADSALVAPNDPLVQKLLALRGNLCAHRNARNVAQEIKIEDRFPLPHSDFDALVQRAVTILNRYSSLFRRSTWSTTIVGHDDFRFVLESVRETINRHEAAVLEEIRRDELRGDGLSGAQ